MISLCLQTCPLDMGAAGELVQLICDLEPVQRPETEFYLVYRRDCPYTIIKAFESLAGAKFGRAKACIARNHAVGWAEGCNMLAMSAFMEMSILRQQEVCRNDGFLLFEPDCVPLLPEWLDVLSAEWERAKAMGKEAFGHWHGADETLHMNGNAVFRSDFIDRHLNLMGGPGLQGWDYWHRQAYISLSTDSDYIYQWYGAGSINAEQLAGVQKNGKRPALFHGVKDGSARAAARQLLLVPAALP
jgi:hypothetical protein